MNASVSKPGGEQKFAPLDLEQVDKTGGFEGYACLFGKRDMGGDIIERGAFCASLKRRGAGNIRMLFQHDPGEPIGSWLALREDNRGLFVRGQLNMDVGRSREVLALMRQGALDGLSIGFRTIKARKGKGVRYLQKVDLWEISIVTFPMQPEARVLRVKGGKLPTKREFERWLVRDAGFTRSQARTLISSGYNLASKQDAASGENERLATAMRRAAISIRNA